MAMAEAVVIPAEIARQHFAGLVLMSVSCRPIGIVLRFYLINYTFLINKPICIWFLLYTLFENKPDFKNIFFLSK